MNDKLYKKPYYIYDLVQVNWLLEQGISPIKVGVGKYGDYYALFERTKETEKLINYWKLERRLMQSSEIHKNNDSE